MLGGSQITDLVMDNAAQMKEFADNLKSNENSYRFKYLNTHIIRAGHYSTCSFLLHVMSVIYREVRHEKNQTI